MDNQTQTPQPEVTVEIQGDVQPETGTPVTQDNGTMIIELETMVKNHMNGVDRLKVEMKKYKEMLESALQNDEGYREASEKAKAAGKEKSKARANVLGNPATKSVANKVKDIALEIKEMNQALSDYLREYQRLSGVNEIEGEDGDIREIIYIAKLIKRNKKFGR